MSLDIRNRLFELAQRSLLGFSLGVGAVAVGLGSIGGVGVELGMLAGVLGWLGWESRPKLFLALGLCTRAAEAARGLAAGAGPSLRGDLHRLTEAVARLATGDLPAAKAALAGVDPRRLPARGRYAYFLDLSVLYLQLGDGEAALAMVEAADAEVVELGPRFSALGSINRSAALCELGRYAEAARCLGEAPRDQVPAGARAYLHNNLAWGLALGGGDPLAALEHARMAVRLRSRDPALSGTLGLCMLIGGEPPEAALPHLLASLEHVQRRSPMGRATLLAAASLAYRNLGREGRAAQLERELAALPRGREGRAAIEAAAPALALPAA